MRIAKLSINNFRGIVNADLIFPSQATVIIGDNNVGKSTVLDALDLVLGPERLSRRPVIDEHDFHADKYLDSSGQPIKIRIEATITGLNEAQLSNFNAHLEWWNIATNHLVENTTGTHILPALRICFIGYYDVEEDDFVGGTYFSNPQLDDDNLTKFSTASKRQCGFLYLRALRTGTRALSLEKGSLLDIILRLKEIRPNMWENVLNSLRSLPVAENPELGLTGIFTGLQTAIQKFVPAEWGTAPHLKVSDLTRENLRRTLFAFIATGAENHAAPFQHQGTGTINMLVLALLSMIAEEKQNVIFAMEEPEIAIPPYAQKRIVDSISKMSSQAIFTSHSPYVIEEFEPENVLVLQKQPTGVLIGKAIVLPANIKYKRYRNDFRGRFAEALLSRRVLITEGATEASAFSAAAKRLAELSPESYSSLESLGLAICDAGTQFQIATFGRFYSGLGKKTFAVYDLQTPADNALIVADIDHPYMSPHKGAERLIVEDANIAALKRFLNYLIDNSGWPSHLNTKHPSPLSSDETVKNALFDYFKEDKGEGRIADFLTSCLETEMPEYIIQTIGNIKQLIEPSPTVVTEMAPTPINDLNPDNEYGSNEGTDNTESAA